MQAVYSMIYVHFIWGTWDRLDLINGQIEPILYEFMTNKSRKLNAVPIQIGGTPNHIHFLVKLTPSIPIWQFAKNIKGSSSHYINQIISPNTFFKWQGGYGAITVSPSHVSIISKYIELQKEHHQGSSTIKKWEIS